MSEIRTYPWPAEYPRSRHFRVRVNDREVEVLSSPAADFASWEMEDPATVEIETAGEWRGAVLRPLARGLPLELAGSRARFALPAPQHLCFEAEGVPSLFLYAHPPAGPAPRGSDVVEFAPGRIHQPDRIELRAGQTLHVPGGAIVQGVVLAENAPGVRLCGRGFFDGGQLRARRGWTRQFLLLDCPGLVVEDLLSVDTCGWTLVLGACDDARIRGFRTLGVISGGDGIDLVGCRRVRVEDCCLRANDDCVVVKACNLRWREPTAPPVGNRDVEDIVVERCVLWNDRSGNALEIGHELRTDHVRGVTFRDCDVLCVHGHGAAFSICNGEHATVSDILFENIRVEHHYDFLLAFRIIQSRYSKEPERGRIRGVTLRDIDAHLSPFNPGYSLSVLGGWDDAHPVEDIAFENFRLGGQRILDPDALDLYQRHTRRVTFR